MPDFRAAERTFQLLVQVAGRAGRGDAPGAVFVQTRSPEHPAIACALRHDVAAFHALELDDRRELGYPPFSRMVLVRLDGLDDARTQSVAAKIAARAEEACRAAKGEVEVRGPTPAPMPRIRNRFRHRILVRGERAAVRAVTAAIVSMLAELPRDVRVVVDVDPLSMM
jgi:primosomal protein N' (replication factor Y)